MSQGGGIVVISPSGTMISSATFFARARAAIQASQCRTAKDVPSESSRLPKKTVERSGEAMTVGEAMSVSVGEELSKPLSGEDDLDTSLLV